MAHIICSTGVLNFLYKEVDFTTDSGQALSAQELEHAQMKYWDDWSKKINLSNIRIHTDLVSGDDST